MGVLRGVSDLFLPRGNGAFKGLFLELKTSKGRPTKSQLDFLVSMKNEGYEGIVCYGADEAIDAIKKFYNMK